MKKTLWVVFCLIWINFLAFHALGNGVNSGKIGVTFSSFGENDVFRFNELDGAASYNGDSFYSIGLTYIFPLNPWLEIETGIEYAKHDIVVKPNLPPDVDSSPKKESFALLNVPVTLRANFFKYFYVNGGMFVGMDGTTHSPNDNQTGLGTLLGVALKYDFENGISAFVNPYTKIHALLPFQAEEYPQRIWENGVRIGISYDLGKKNNP